MLIEKLRRIELDLLFINALSLNLIFSIMCFPTSVLRPILAFPFVTFFSGYTFLKIYYSEEEINMLERIALSFGLSMIIVPLLGLIIACSPLKIEVYSVLFSIYLFILVTSIIGQYRSKSTFRESIKQHINLKKINFILVIVLITLLGIFIRFYPALDYSSFGGNWMPGNHLYPVYYALQNGELLERGAISTLTKFSFTIYNVLHNKAFILFQICTCLVSGFTGLNEFLFINKFFPWCGALLFPLSALLVANGIAKNQGKDIPSHYYLFLYFVANFASYRLLMDSRFMLNNLIISFSMMLFTIYFLLGRKNPKNQLLGILFGVFTFLYYYTAGLVFLIILISILVIQAMRKEEVISRNYILFYGISFVAYYVYLAQKVSRSFILALKDAIISPGSNPALAVVGTGKMSDIGNIYILSAYFNMFLILVLLITFVYWWVRKKVKQTFYTNFTVYLCSGLIFVGLLPLVIG